MHAQSCFPQASISSLVTLTDVEIPLVSIVSEPKEFYIPTEAIRFEGVVSGAAEEDLMSKSARDSFGQAGELSQGTTHQGSTRRFSAI